MLRPHNSRSRDRLEVKSPPVLRLCNSRYREQSSAQRRLYTPPPVDSKTSDFEEPAELADSSDCYEPSSHSVSSNDSEEQEDTIDTIAGSFDRNLLDTENAMYQFTQKK